MPPGNVIIAQSGGPSPVINNTLRAIINSCRSDPQNFGKIYGAWHGIEGVLKEELLDITAQDSKEIELLRNTPAAGSIGTCRYKITERSENDLNRITEVFIAHNIGYFFYIGGNDSQHTALKIGKKCKETGLEVVTVGVPKTIDNDLGDAGFELIDHTPGYGSVARYWCCYTQNLNEENRGSSPVDPVMVVQAMGRRTGFIPAAARLADPQREMPLQIYLAESGLSFPELAENVKNCLGLHGRCMVIVSEGMSSGTGGSQKDSFGHIQYGSAKTNIQQAVVNYLNDSGIKARGQVPGTDQRHAMVYASETDLLEAYRVGEKAAEIALEGQNGWMASLIREAGPYYNIRYDKVALEKMALSERVFPGKWISGNRYDVTDEYIEYALPLIGSEWVRIPLENGRQRFTRFKPVFAEKKLNKYIPENY
ncbi:MAG: diphosphate--fructose-6-phosphate 1-phosphotransferase [Bacteroidales bacterium]|nr:diphosphate--fructose-6-phosphate 1-phosphotransferase [Bacteroidales bacterium]